MNRTDRDKVSDSDPFCRHRILLGMSCDRCDENAAARAVIEAKVRDIARLQQRLSEVEARAERKQDELNAMADKWMAERSAHEETRRELGRFAKLVDDAQRGRLPWRDDAGNDRGRPFAEAAIYEDQLAAERQARERAEAALSRARELLRENRAAFAICQIPAATMEVDGFDGGPWDMCPHCGAVAEECDKLADCWGAKTRAYLADPAASPGLPKPCGPGCGAVVGRAKTPMYCSEACCDAGHPLNPTTSKE